MKLKYGILAASITLLAGCGSSSSSTSSSSSGGSSSGSTISGKVVDGYIKEANVSIGGKSVLTDVNGSWTLSGLTLTDSTYVSVTGGTDTSTGQPFDSNTTLKAMVSSATTSLHITPLTTLVADVKIADTNNTSVSTIEAKIATSLGLGADGTILNADPLSDINNTNSQKALKAMLQVQKFSESYNKIADKNVSGSGLSLIATQLFADKNISTALDTVQGYVTDGNASAALNLVKKQLNDINESSLTSSSSVNNISKAVEIATSEIEKNLESNTTSVALQKAKMLAVTGLKKLTTNVESNSDVNASTYANTFFADTNSSVALYTKLEQLSNDTNLTLDNILSDISKNSDPISVIQSAVAESNNTSFDINSTLADYNSTITSAENNLSKISSITNGYYEKVVAYDGTNDANFTVNLPNGAFYIIAEYSSSNKLIQSQLSSAVKDENGNTPDSSTSTITGGNLRTSSTAIAKLNIENSSSEVKTYVIPVSAFNSTSSNNIATNIWVAAITTTSSDVNNTKNNTLVLDNNTSNTGVVLVEDEQVHNWSFTTDSNASGTYSLSVDTSNSLYKNPLQYFTVNLVEGGTKQLINGETGQATTEGSLSVGGVTLKNSTSYVLKLKATPIKSDALGYYTIKLNKQ